MSHLIRVNLRMFFVFSLFIFGLSLSFSAQELPPKVGQYYCYTTNYVIGGGRINSRTGQDVFGNNPLQVVPAFFGNIIFDENNNYRFTGQKGGGKYIFNKATSKLSFTGDLGVMKVEEYTSKNYSFFILYKDLAYHCGLQGAKTKPPNTGNSNNDNQTPSVLNEGLSGKILTTQSDRNNGFIGKVFEFDLAKGDYSIIFPDGVAAQNPKGEILHIDKESRIKISDRTGNSTIKQLTKNINLNSDELYPSISNSGENIALTVANRSNTGTLDDLIAKGVKVLVTDRNLQKVAEFVGYRQAAWKPDGGLVVAGDGNANKGLYVIDAKFKTVKKIVEGYDYAQMPAVSPDGKTVAFANKGEIWTVNLDGTNLTKAMYGNECSFPAWSPDGKFLIASVAIIDLTNKNAMYIVNLRTDKGFYLKDSSGDYVQSKNRITWLPNTSGNTDAPTTFKQNAPKPNGKIVPNPATNYQPIKTNDDPKFAKAFEVYQQVMADDIENFNDVAAAFTYAICSNYSFLRQQNEIPTSQVRKIYEQFVQKLLQIEGFKDADNATKQQLAETAIIDGLEIFVAANTKDQVKIKEVSLRNLKKYIGKSAENMKITDNGMEF